MAEFTEEQRIVVLAAADWLYKNRPELHPYILDSSSRVGVNEDEGRLSVSIAIKGPRKYKFFTFQADTSSGEVTLVRESD